MNPQQETFSPDEKINHPPGTCQPGEGGRPPSVRASLWTPGGPRDASQQPGFQLPRLPAPHVQTAEPAPQPWRPHRQEPKAPLATGPGTGRSPHGHHTPGKFPEGRFVAQRGHIRNKDEKTLKLQLKLLKRFENFKGSLSEHTMGVFLAAVG